MRTVYLPDNKCLQRMKKAHIYRALLKRREAEAVRRQLVAKRQEVNA